MKLSIEGHLEAAEQHISAVRLTLRNGAKATETKTQKAKRKPQKVNHPGPKLGEEVCFNGELHLHLRLAAGWSRAQVGAQVGCDRSHIRYLEKNVTRRPSLGLVKAMEELFQVPAGMLTLPISKKTA